MIKVKTKDPGARHRLLTHYRERILASPPVGVGVVLSSKRDQLEWIGFTAYHTDILHLNQPAFDL